MSTNPAIETPNGANALAAGSALPLTQWTPAWSRDLPCDERPSTILIVDGHSSDCAALGGALEQEGHRVLMAARTEEALVWLTREAVDLVILELDAPGTERLEFCRAMKRDRRTRLIPLMLLSDARQVETEVAGLGSGADEFLVRPLNLSIIRMRIRTLLRHKSAIDSLEDAESVLLTLALAVERRDKDTHCHCERLAGLSTALGAALGLPRSQLVALYRGGFLHDIGKIGVPDSILFKPGRLSEPERRVIQTHTTIGVEICRAAKTLAPVLPIIRSHHERWDGSGYPDGIKGEEIPITARVLQVADVYDALTNVRPYKAAWSSAAALDELDREARRGWRQPQLVSMFRKLIERPQDVLPWPGAAANDTAEALIEMHKAIGNTAEPH